MRPEIIYLFERGLTGYHLLFDDDLIDEALYADSLDILADSEKYHDVLNEAVHRLMDARSLAEARNTIANLPRPVARLFAYIYFQAINRSFDKHNATVH